MQDGIRADADALVRNAGLERGEVGRDEGLGAAARRLGLGEYEDGRKGATHEVKICSRRGRSF